MPIPEPSDELDQEEQESNLIDGDEAAGLTWARFEVHREKTNWMPIRSLEHDEDLLDAERRVKFADIRNVLFCLPDDELLLRLCFACVAHLGAVTLNDTIPGSVQFNELLNRRVSSIGQLLFNVRLDASKNVVDAIDMLSQVDFDQITVPALGHVYDIDRKIFHYLPKRLNGMVLRMWQQIIDKSEVCGAFKGQFEDLMFVANIQPSLQINLRLFHSAQI